jgi:hypothetical protein
LSDHNPITNAAPLPVNIIGTVPVSITLAVGDPITGGAAGEVLFIDPTGTLIAVGLLKYVNGTLTLTIGSPTVALPGIAVRAPNPSLILEDTNAPNANVCTIYLASNGLGVIDQLLSLDTAAVHQLELLADPTHDIVMAAGATTKKILMALGASNFLRIDSNGVTPLGCRVHEAQGAQVNAANNLTLGLGGNWFAVAGNTQVNLIDKTGWQDGSCIWLHFTGLPTVKNNQATAGNNTKILLAGGADLVVAAVQTVPFRLSTVGGVQAWRQDAPAVLVA